MEGCLVRQVIALQFPALADVEILPIAEGSDHWTWRIGEDWIFRFPKEADTARRLLAEHRLLPTISPVLPIPVPSEFLLGEASDLFPHRFLGHRRLPGASGEEKRPDAVDHQPIARQIGRFFSVLHSQDLALPRRFDVSEEHGPELREAHDSVRRALPTLKTIEKELPPGALRFAEHTPVPAHWPYGLSLCHWDIKGEHILLSERADRVVGIIDWTDTGITDPVVDFAGLALWLGPPFVRMVLQEYDSRDRDLLWERAAFFAKASSLERLARLLAGEHAGPRWLLLRQVASAFL